MEEVAVLHTQSTTSVLEQNRDCHSVTTKMIQTLDHTLMWEYNAAEVSPHDFSLSSIILLELFIADCISWEVRLEGGETEWEGRLEVCINRRWGTVGNEGWSLVNSQVVCNSLGFDLAGVCKSFLSINVFTFLFMSL